MLDLVLVDPRGCGRSPAASSFGFDDDVADLEAVRERLGLDALEAPERLRAEILQFVS